MAKTIEFDINVNAGDSINSMKSLEDRVESLKESIKGAEIGTTEFKQLQSELIKADSQLKNLEKSIEGVDTAQLAGSFAKLGEGIVGGFAVASSALSAFGTESEEIAAAQAKAQQLLTIVMGARAVAEGVTEGAVAARTVAETANATLQKIRIGLFGAEKVALVQNAVATNTATVAQRVLNAVMAASPIFLLVTVIGAAAAAWAIYSANAEEATAEQDKLNASLQQATEDLEIQIFQNKQIIESENQRIDNSIKKSQLLGEAESEQIKLEQEKLRTRQKNASIQVEIAEDAIRSIDDQNRALEEQLKTAKGDRAQELNDIRDANIKKKQELIKVSNEEFQITQKFESENELLELKLSNKIKEENQKRVDDAKKAAEQRLQNERVLQDSRLAIIQDDRTREIAILEASAERQIQDSKLNGTQLAEFKANVETKLSIDKTAVNDKYNKEAEDKEREHQERLIQIQSDYALQVEELERQSTVRKAQIRAGETGLSIEEQAARDIEVVKAKSQAEIDEFASRLQREKELLDQQRLDKDITDAQYNEILLQKQSEFDDQKLLNEQETAAAIVAINEDAENQKQAKQKETRDKQFENLQFGLQSSASFISSLQKLEQASTNIKLARAKGNAEEEEKIRKKSFENQKKMNIAMAVINGALAVTNILATVPKADFGVATAIMIGLAALTTASEIAVIASQQYQGGGGSSSVASPGSNIALPQTTPATPTAPTAPQQSVQGTAFDPSKIGQAGGAQRVYVVESDISTVQNRVSVIEEKARIR